MNNLTIKFKLYALAGLVAVCLILMSFIALNSFSKMMLLNKTLLLVQTSEADMLMLRRNEKDFLARLDIKYKNKFHDNFEALISVTTQLENNTTSLNLAHTQQMAELSQYLHAYHSSFNEIITFNQTLGLDPQSGLRGKLRKSIHEVEGILKDSGSIQLTADMLMLRRNEKDFMLRKLDKYIGKFNTNYGIFNQHLNESTLSYIIKDELTSKMNAYHSMFIEFTQNHLKLGLTSKMGLQGEMRNTIHKTEEIFESLFNKLSAEIASQSEATYSKLLMLSTLLIVLILVTIFSIARTVNSRLGYLHQHLSDVALKSGDLSATLTISGNDEITAISQLFNKFVGNLKNTFSQIPTFTTNLEQAAHINSDISAQTSNLASSQQQKSDELTEAVIQLVGATEEITSNIHTAASLAEEANSSVTKGKLAINDVSSSINSLAEKLQSSAGITQNLEENSNSISSVLDVIQGIAEQTNLLALNAAIEAARAGEQGRGFAVVADEVRTLASRTQESTTQIKSLIDDFQLNVRNTVDVMQKGSEGARLTAEDATNAIQTLDVISNAVNKIFELNTSIASASEEQSMITKDISQNIINIDETAKETAAQSNEASQSSEQISTIAKDLQSLIATYRF